jgi:carboxyl-terminal processing protease
MGMQMKYKIGLLLLALFTTAFNVTLAAPLLVPLQQQSEAAHLSAEILNKYHYKHLLLDDKLSSKIFDNYFKALDAEKIFLFQSDIDLFAQSRNKLDDAILKQDLSIPFAIYHLAQKRIAERISYARSLLKTGFDFEKKESYQFNRKDLSWPKSAEEMNELWRKRVKNDWLRLRLAGETDKNIVATLGKRYDNSLKGMSKIKSDDIFENFMNAYALAIDPHTNYLGIHASDEFDISMRLSLVGIGAVLQEKDEYTTIRELVPGGPAALSGKLKVGDRIVGVGQGLNSSTTDVMGWRIDETVVLIRGTEDSVVVLDILPVEAGTDGVHKLISLVRKKISLDKQAAKKSIIEAKDGDVVRHIGVISLPGFYQDFAAHQKGDKNYRSATRDVSRLLAELNKDKVDSVLIDLRNNGGGSLDEAIELTGLFIDKGPVVQQRDSQGNVSVASDTNTGVAWDGPLGVLINRASASASEIFAAAIQDYGRGVIIGEQSFGKGTVQSVVNLDQLANNAKPKFGELKMTIAQFFRINGGTTQLRGVTPDIPLPALTDMEDFGESSFDNALPWTQIKAADYTPIGDLTGIVPMLVASHEARVSKDKDFQNFQEDIAGLNIQRKKNQLSLNEVERRKEREEQAAKMKLREKDRVSGKDSAEGENLTFQDDGLQSNERKLDADLAMEKANKHSKDILLNEAVNILGDEVSLLNANPRLAAAILSKLNVR